MEILENKENLKSILTVKISKGDYQPLVEKELKKARQTAQIKGFRPGTAPMSMIKRMYEPSIRFDEITKLLNETMENHLKNETRKIIGQVIPFENQSNNWNNEDLEFSFEAGFFPELEYQLSEETELPFYNITVEQQHIDDHISNLRKQLSSFNSVDTVEENDKIYFSFKVETEGDVKKDDNTEEKIKVESEIEKVESEIELEKLESETEADIEVEKDTDTKYGDFLMSMIPEEYKSLFIGAKVDSNIEVELRKVFPNETDLLKMLDINKEDLDKIPEFVTLKVSSIERYEQSELDQDFFDAVADEDDKIHNEEELNVFISDMFKKQYLEVGTTKLASDFKEYAETNINFELPEDFVERFLCHIIQEESDKSTEAIKEEVTRDLAKTLKLLKWHHIEDTLMEREKIEITNEEIVKVAETDVFNKFGGYYNLDAKFFDEIMKIMLGKKENVERYIMQIKQDKMGVLLRERVKLNYVDISLSDFTKMMEQKNKNVENTENTENVENIESAENQPEEVAEQSPVETETENSSETEQITEIKE